MTLTLGWTISEWLDAYGSGQITPRIAIHSLREYLAANMPDPAWIYLLTAAEVDVQLDALETIQDAASLPLFGIPFAVKDNIDVAGIPTTAACPAFSYVPEADATSVARLKKAGAIVLGKTNLDQFATGLVGTRSPYGAVSNSFKTEYPYSPPFHSTHKPRGFYLQNTFP